MITMEEIDPRPRALSIQSAATIGVARAQTSPSPRNAPPSQTTASEEAALRRVRGLSRLLDEAIRVPGTNFRIGLDPILGVLPVGGDAVTALVSLYPIVEAYRFGASRRTLARMGALVAVDALVGSIPVVGDVFDAFFKANARNARTFERLLSER